MMTKFKINLLLKFKFSQYIKQIGNLAPIPADGFAEQNNIPSWFPGNVQLASDCVSLCTKVYFPPHPALSFYFKYVNRGMRVTAY